MSNSNNSMMKTVLTLTCLFLTLTTFGQSETDKEEVQSACMGYLEGFYEGDTVKLKNSIRPSLYKFGYWKSKDSGNYEAEGQMTYRQAIDYAKGVMEKKHFAKPDAPKQVEILDISNHLAAAKITAWWGTDYALLTKNDGKWMIEQVLWEGPLEK
jgi:hypothetical protein